MPTGGQLLSGCGSSEGAAGCSGASGLPPNRLLTRSVKDCADADDAKLPAPIASDSEATIAILMRGLSPIAVILKIFRPSVPRVQWIYSRQIGANPRHRSRRQCSCSTTILAAEILMQQAEQQVILPDAVDAEIAPRQPLAAKAAFLEHADRRRVGGNAGGFHPVQIELAKQGRQQHSQRRRHVAAMRMRLADPIADSSGLHDA